MVDAWCETQATGYSFDDFLTDVIQNVDYCVYRITQQHLIYSLLIYYAAVGDVFSL